MKPIQSIPRLLLCGLAAFSPLGCLCPAQAGGLADPYVVLRQDSISDLGSFTLDPSPPLNLGTFDIIINAGPTLAGNAPALAAFDRAAALWESYIADPILVTITADMANLGNPNIIGQASSVLLQAPYATIRGQMVTDEAAEGSVHPIVAAIPGSEPSWTLPAGYSSNLQLSGSKASLKALGFLGLDGAFGASDSTITFNSTFSFDYDNSDGVAGGTMDFEMVAAHEIGHALGFSSSVDLVDSVPGQAFAPRTLDLFRFSDGDATDPADATGFGAFARNLEPGTAANTDLVYSLFGAAAENLMSTGVNNGDGHQASHWKDDLGIGLMDPTLAYGELTSISPADLVALDVIGYNILIPEPESVLLASVFLLGGVATARVRSRRRTVVAG